MEIFAKWFEQKTIKQVGSFKVINKVLSPFEKFLKIIIFLEDLINNSPNFNNVTSDILREFWKEKCVEFPHPNELLCKIRKM